MRVKKSEKGILFMKILSIAVPCYNSQDYMRNCIDSLLVGGEEIEILIVNDGSVDDTAKIADEYQEKYPSIVKAIHKPNGGHGSGVNAGIKNATGKYFKVVDSDDWVDEDAYKKILSTLREFVDKDCNVDLLVSNYVYEKVGAKHKTVINYRGILPENRVLTWDETGHFKKGHYILMHAAIYRTELLRDCKLELPEHTFYVDNLYVYVPLPYVERLYYLDVDFYRYFIGRDDQSVQENVMIKRIDQQIRVNKLMLSMADLKSVKNKKLQKYMLSYLEIITTVSSIMLMRSGTEQNINKRNSLWNYIKTNYPWEYKKLYGRVMGKLVNVNSRLGRKFTLTAYKAVQKLVGFN